MHTVTTTTFNDLIFISSVLLQGTTLGTLLPSKTQHVIQPTRCILSFYLDDNVQRHVCSSDHGNRHAYTFGLVQPPHLNLDCLARPKPNSHCQSQVTSRTLHQEDLAQLETTSLQTFDFLDSKKETSPGNHLHTHNA